MASQQDEKDFIQAQQNFYRTTLEYFKKAPMSMTDEQAQAVAQQMVKNFVQYVRTSNLETLDELAGDYLLQK